jgi:DNA-3-methyladenine glycosylase I
MTDQAPTEPQVGEVRPGVEPGPDGVLRCSWANGAPEYHVYHDTEWGRPLHGESALFERLALESFQSGLAWITILRKRENFRAAFAGFDPEVVAGFGDDDHARLMADAGIVRNRAKITATIANARAVLALRHTFPGGLDALIWSYAPDPAAWPVPRSLADIPATSTESVALAKALRSHGFVFLGPTTMYAAMQACGLVNDHVEGCTAR